MKPDTLDPYEQVSGPKVTVKLSCFDCSMCRTESYACQGDSGQRVSCAAMNRFIGDTTWDTPKWCPLLAPSHAQEAARQVQERIDGKVSP